MDSPRSGGWRAVSPGALSLDVCVVSRSMRSRCNDSRLPELTHADDACRPHGLPALLTGRLQPGKYLILAAVFTALRQPAKQEAGMLEIQRANRRRAELHHGATASTRALQIENDASFRVSGNSTAFTSATRAAALSTSAQAVDQQTDHLAFIRDAYPGTGHELAVPHAPHQHIDRSLAIRAIG
jgi:hypothetical protein